VRTRRVRHDMMMLIVVLAVSGALIAGALWGIYGKLSAPVEGFLVAVAGGALIVSIVSELIEPSMDHLSVWSSMGGMALGALVFTGADWLIARYWREDSGGGLLAAITLDGVPENLALGVALIGAGATEVAALAGSIFLSNLPEAAGGARDMAGGGASKARTFGLWTATAALLAAAAVAGNLLLAGVSKDVLALIRCFAGGAVVASLATEVFPKAYNEDRKLAGIATALGLGLAFLLGSLSGGG
jgi:zinc transporter, ZIP family